MHKVAVLMSTYNGEEYLREQIESILAQEDVDVTLYIRDDGSSDSTIEIVQEYQKKHSNIKFNVGKNLGVGNSFMQLVYDCPNEYAYYAFSDQDDVWLSEKLKKAVEMIEEFEKPVLYASNQMLVDKAGNEIALRYPKDYKIPVSLEAEFQTNQISGCTFVFNQELKKVLSEFPKRPSKALLQNRIHDVWVAVIASLYDGIIYDNKAYIQYRQHEKNVVGGFAHGRLYDLKEKLKKLKNPTFRNGRSMISEELCRTFPDKSAEHKLIYCCCDGLTLKAKLLLIRHIGDLRKYSSETYLGLLGKIVFGLY